MFEQIKEIITRYVEVDAEQITPDSRFIEDLGFSSFDFVTMIGELEYEFDIEVNEQEVVEIRTVGEAISYVEKLIDN